MRARPLCILALCFLACLLIALFLGGDSNALPEAIKEGMRVEGRGTISKIEVRNNTSSVYLDNFLLVSESEEYQLQTIIFKTNENCDYDYGSTLQISGKVRFFESATNPGQFDTAAYYKSLGIDLAIEGDVEGYDSGNTGVIENGLLRLRRKVSGIIDGSGIDDESKAIIKAVMLGDKTSLTSEQKRSFQSAGIIHLLSISGLHITIVGMGIYKLLRGKGVSFGLSSIVSGTCALMFVLLTGASYPALRAFTMFVILLVAENLGRTADGLTSLSVAALVLLVGNKNLLTNSGFILSFVAVLGVISGRNVWGRIKDALKGRSENPILLTLMNLLADAAMGIWLWLFMLPVLAHIYYEVPLYSWLVNMLVIPLAPLLLTGSMIGALAGLLWLPMGCSAMAIPGFLVSLISAISDITAGLPGAVIITGQPSLWGVALYYACLFTVTYLLTGDGLLLSKLTTHLTGVREKLVKSGVIFGIGLIMFASICFHPRFSTEIAFLNVGQGDSIVIKCSNGSTILIDGGSSTVSHVGEKRIVQYLKYYGITEIDKIILTHPDSDHMNGLDEVLTSNIKVKAVLTAIVQSKDEKIIQLRDKIKNQNENSFSKTKMQFVQGGDYFIEGETSFKILGPDGGKELSDNAASLVVEMEYKGAKALFTGDVEGEGEDLLVESGVLEDVDILKVAHHGSKNSTSEEFLQQVSPEISIISCGEHNSYGHPHKETIGRLKAAGSRIYSTPDCGAIEIEVGNEIRIGSFKNQ